MATALCRTGLARLTELALANRWLELGREVRAFSRLRGQPWLGPYRDWVVRFGLLRALRSRRRNGTHALSPPLLPYERSRSADWTRGLAPEFAAWLTTRVEGEPRRIPGSESEDHLRRLTQDALFQGLSFLEAMGAGAGVEVRFPFFDLRLVETCLALPPEQKLMNGWTRVVMRNAMRGVLPEAIRTRPDKADLTHGLNHALRRNAPCDIALVLGALDDDVSRFIDLPQLERSVSSFMAGRTTTPQDVLMWRKLSLALWLRRNRGAATAGAVRAAWTADRHIRKEV